MSTESKKEIQLEITHVLFMDIVGYSKMLINEQRALHDIIPSGWYNFLVAFSIHADQFFHFGVRLPYAKFPRHSGL
jgi:hypothetical protein